MDFHLTRKKVLLLNYKEETPSLTQKFSVTESIAELNVISLRKHSLL